MHIYQMKPVLRGIDLLVLSLEYAEQTLWKQFPASQTTSLTRWGLKGVALSFLEGRRVSWRKKICESESTSTVDGVGILGDMQRVLDLEMSRAVPITLKIQLIC